MPVLGVQFTAQRALWLRLGLLLLCACSGLSCSECHLCLHPVSLCHLVMVCSCLVRIPQQTLPGVPFQGSLGLFGSPSTEPSAAPQVFSICCLFPACPASISSPWRLFSLVPLSCSLQSPGRSLVVVVQLATSAVTPRLSGKLCLALWPQPA